MKTTKKIRVAVDEVRERWPTLSILSPDPHPNDDYVERGDYLLPRELRIRLHGTKGQPDVEMLIQSDEHGRTDAVETHIYGSLSDLTSLNGVRLPLLLFVGLEPRTLRRIASNVWSGWPKTEHDMMDELGFLVTSRRRRSRLTDEFLAGIADEYRQAVADGQPPVRAIAEAHGKTTTEAQRQTVVYWVRKARERGLLSKTTRGKVSSDVVD